LLQIKLEVRFEKLPLLYARKEVFTWIKQGKKTIDIRKGLPKRGEIAVFQSGPYSLKSRIIKIECGLLVEVLRTDNYRLVVPSSQSLSQAIDYLRGIYGDCDGVFSAYYVVPLSVSEKS
jgi:ASC-1-like (ASCH) protein